tara:strand:- start:808 stop:2655 length:1848 start_codon:yes stop_codon:yes gene_type:complete
MKKSQLRKIIRESIKSISQSPKLRYKNTSKPLPPKDKKVLEEGPFSARGVKAEVCSLPSVGLHPGGGTPSYGLALYGNTFNFSKMTIGGNKPEVGDIFKNSPSINGTAQSGGQGDGYANGLYYRVTETSSWSMGTTTNFPSSNTGQCNDSISYPNQFVCGWEKSTQNVNQSAVNFKNGGVKSCHEVPNEAIVEDYIRAGFWWPQDASGWDNNDPSTWTLRQFGGGNPVQQIGTSPPILDWWVFFNSVSECKSYCGSWDDQFGGSGGTFGCMDQLWGVPMTQPGCVPAYPWDMNAYPYSNISACQLDCEFDDFESDWPGFDGDRWMCDGENCAPCDYTLVTNTTTGGWYGPDIYGPCKFTSEQDCNDAQSTTEGCSYPENPKFRCGHCDVNTPCTQFQIDNNPGVCIFDNITDCSNYCDSTSFFGTEFYKCPRPDKFGNISPNCSICSAYEVILSMNAGQPNHPNYIAGANDPGCTSLPDCQDKINQGICTQGKIDLAPGGKGTEIPNQLANNPTLKKLDPEDEIGSFEFEPELDVVAKKDDKEFKPVDFSEPEYTPEPEPEMVVGCSVDGDCDKGQRCEKGICIEDQLMKDPLTPTEPIDRALMERMQKLANIKK